VKREVGIGHIFARLGGFGNWIWKGPDAMIYTSYKKNLLRTGPQSHKRAPGTENEPGKEIA
jgi:hypothetical protein